RGRCAGGALVEPGPDLSRAHAHSYRVRQTRHFPGAIGVATPQGWHLRTGAPVAKRIELRRPHCPQTRWRANGINPDQRDKRVTARSACPKLRHAEKCGRVHRTNEYQQVLEET